MADQIHLQIVTPSAIVADEAVRYVRLPLEGGSIGVLRGHAPLLGAVTGGVLKYARADADYYVAVSDGVVHVASDEITVLVHAAVCADSAETARDTARQMKNERK